MILQRKAMRALEQLSSLVVSQTTSEELKSLLLRHSIFEMSISLQLQKNVQEWENPTSNTQDMH